MKTILEPLQKKGYLFKRLEPFSLKEIGSKKKIVVFHGVDMRNRYTLLFFIDKKSRVLQKEVKEWFEIKIKIEHFYGYPILRNIAIVHAPLCSKAKALLKYEGWDVIV